MWRDLISTHLRKSQRPLIVILGPTASGKTAFSIEVAKVIEKAEIVNADSRQLYKYLDIGTAKISEEDMRGVPHHLLSVLDPKEEVTIAWYKEQATRTIHEVLVRGNVPILVGGSMLYLSSIIDGLEPLPPVDPKIRERLSMEYERDRGRTLYRRLRELDPDSAVSIHPHNKVYLVRALEIFEGTKKPASVQRQKSGCPYDLLIFGMQWPREELVSRINERTRLLFARGWVEEVKGLLQRGYTVDDPGMKSQGYREILERIQKTQRSIPLEEVERDEQLMETIAAKARQYSKRQMTWWRPDGRIQWVSFACHPEVRVPSPSRDEPRRTLCPLPRGEGKGEGVL